MILEARYGQGLNDVLRMTLKAEKNGIALWQDDKGGYRVTRVDHGTNTVASVLERDVDGNSPPRLGSVTYTGVMHVTSGSISRSTAHKHFRELTQD